MAVANSLLLSPSSTLAVIGLTAIAIAIIIRGQGIEMITAIVGAIPIVAGVDRYVTARANEGNQGKASEPAKAS